MKITVFTSNQPRHLALINRLAEISELTYAIMECNTVFPGRVQDFYNKSAVMQNYFSQVIAAEKNVFGGLTFLKPNVRSLAIKSGDVNLMAQDQLKDALHSDVYIVFGASYIKGWLIDFLVAQQAINIHMGVSPYYRGSSCNFWALYDASPHYVGATIHRLSRGLDSGAMLYHALPKFNGDTPFLFTMRAVEAAQLSLVARIEDRTLLNYTPQLQDKQLEMRYTRNIDFTDQVAGEFLERGMDTKQLEKLLMSTAQPDLLHPFLSVAYKG